MTLVKDSPLLEQWLRSRFPHVMGSRPIDVHLPWAEDTEMLGILIVEGERYFVGGHEVTPQSAEAGDYRGLSDAECEAIRHYRALRLYQPWPQPTIGVAASADGQSLVTAAPPPGPPGAASDPIQVALQSIGSSQCWWGGEAGVIWEVLLGPESFPPDQFRGAYTGLWQQVEGFLRTRGVRHVVTEFRDPAFADDWYQDVLRSMGYTQLGQGPFRKEL